jgi:RNase P/RNase MRP subunit POP5
VFRNTDGATRSSWAKVLLVCHNSFKKEGIIMNREISLDKCNQALALGSNFGGRVDGIFVLRLGSSGSMR